MYGQSNNGSFKPCFRKPYHPLLVEISFAAADNSKF